MIALLLAGAGFITLPANAQSNYPSRPVRIMVASEAGGGTDIVARILADRLTQSMGQPFVIENRPGAGGLIGIELAARAAADGYTLLTVASNITILPVTNKNAKYNLLRDFAPITQLINSTSVLLVNPGLSINSVKDLIAQAKVKPGELSYASAGIGTQPHMGMELLAMMAGIALQHIPYKGVAPAMTDVIGGRVSSMLGNLTSAKSQIDGGYLRGLAVLHHETVQALASSEMQKRMAADGTETVGSAPTEFAARIKSELEKWEKVARAANIHAE